MDNIYGLVLNTFAQGQPVFMALVRGSYALGLWAFISDYLSAFWY